MTEEPARESLLTEILRLTERSLTDEITPDEVLRLNTLVLTEERADELYLQAIMDLRQLRRWAGVSELDRRTEAIASSGRPSLKRSELRWSRVVNFINRPQVFSTIFAVSFLSAVLTIGAIWRVSYHQQHATATPHVAEHLASSEAKVARVVGAWECDWVKPPAASNIAINEPIELHKGVVKLQFICGAEVLIAGPARFRVDSAMSGALDNGSLTCVVPPRGRGFSITTQRLRVVDLGTEFGVRAPADGDAEVHVFSGQVEVQWRNATGEVRQRVTQNQALRHDAARRTTDLLSADASRFVRTLPQTPSRYELAISPEYVAAVRRSAPLAYWRFEKLEDNRQIRGEVGENHLDVHGLTQFRGTPENYVADVPAGADFKSELPFTGLRGKEYSIELWLQPRGLKEGVVLMMWVERSTDLWSPIVYVHTSVETRREQSLRLLRVGISPDHNPHVGASALHRYPLQGWRHLVIVKTAKQTQLYMQGAAVAAADNTTLHEGERYRLTLASSVEHHRNPIWYEGNIDEVAIYPRALSAEEVAQHFAAVKLVPLQPKR